MPLVFFGARNVDKLELLNKQVLRVVLNDTKSPYEALFTKLGTTSLEDRRLRDMLVLVYKCVNGLAPSYLSLRLIERTSGYGLRGARKLVLPKPRTTTHGSNSFTYSATNPWKSLPDIA